MPSRHCRPKDRRTDFGYFSINVSIAPPAFTSRDPEFGREFLIRRADRLMFGTDYLSPGQEVPQLELFRAIDLPVEVQAKVFRDNARTLLGLI